MRPPAELGFGFVIDGLYAILGQIAVGGTASVYRARQLETDELVAVKLIHLGDGDVSAERRRFFNELLLATRVRHPNIAAVHDFGLLASAGAPYIVMELLEGLDLRQQLLRHGPLPLGQALPLFLGALEALAAAHERSVVHKDLKPSNLFLCGAGTPGASLVVVDFGTAARGGLVEEGVFHGTPRYAAPEYVLDQRVGPQLDVYQVGLVLCEAVTGSPVVQDTDREACFRAHLDGCLDIPADALGPQLAEVVTRALARDPADRFPHAGAFLEALSSVGTSPSVRGREAAEPDTDETDEAEAPTRLFVWQTGASEVAEAPEEDGPALQPVPLEAPPTRRPSRLRVVAAVAIVVLILVLVVASGL